MVRRIHPTTALLLLVFLAQLAFAYSARSVQSRWTILPPAPTQRELDAEAFGDHEFLYRLLVADLQNFGDTGGHSTQMGEYDIGAVVAWLKALDYLDKDADHHLKLAMQYFVWSQDTSHLGLLVNYVREQVATTPARHWRWLFDATYIARAKLHDLPLATAVADQLSSYDFPDMVLIARQLGAAMHREIGDYEGAADRMERVLKTQREKVPADEVVFMEKFIAAMRLRAQQGHP